MLFWIFAGLMTVLAALVVVLPILRKRQGTTVSGASDFAVYRDQLKELDADVARGVLSAAEAEGSRTEISRRLLAADARQSSQAEPAPQLSSRGAVIGLALALIIGAPLLYSVIGAPGTPDQPLLERMTPMSQLEAEAQYAQSTEQTPSDLGDHEKELLAKLMEALEERPDDLTGYRLLAQTLSSVGDFKGAITAQDDVIRILGDAVTTDDLAEKAELMIFAAGGYVSPEADQILARALQLSRANQRARYYSGVSMAQNGKPEVAMQLWAGLLAEGDPNAPWKEPVREQMRFLSSSTGIHLPEALLNGPDQDDIDAASELSDEERQDMIRGMVDGLNDRLATEGGSPAEWARLIRALGVLGDTDQAQAIYSEAKNTFAQNEAGLSAITEAAQSIGLE